MTSPQQPPGGGQWTPGPAPYPGTQAGYGQQPPNGWQPAPRVSGLKKNGPLIAMGGLILILVIVLIVVLVTRGGGSSSADLSLDQLNKLLPTSDQYPKGFTEFKASIGHTSPTSSKAASDDKSGYKTIVTPSECATMEAPWFGKDATPMKDNIARLTLVKSGSEKYSWSLLGMGITSTGVTRPVGEIRQLVAMCPKTTRTIALGGPSSTSFISQCTSAPENAPDSNVDEAVAVHETCTTTIPALTSPDAGTSDDTSSGSRSETLTYFASSHGLAFMVNGSPDIKDAMNQVYATLIKNIDGR